MQKIEILGHCNAGLSMIFDSLYSKFKDQFTVNIISNISEKDNLNSNMPFKIEGIHVNEIFHDEWKQDNAAIRIIAGTRSFIRRKIFDFFFREYGITLETYDHFIHASSNIAYNTMIGYGTLIGPGVTIAPFADLGNMVNINRAVSIGHHTKIEDFVNINPGVTVNGSIYIKKNATIGAGATIMDKVSIGENTVIGAGSVVTKSIPDNLVVYGIPAKIVKNEIINI